MTAMDIALEPTAPIRDASKEYTLRIFRITRTATGLKGLNVRLRSWAY